MFLSADADSSGLMILSGCPGHVLLVLLVHCSGWSRLCCEHSQVRLLWILETRLDIGEKIKLKQIKIMEDDIQSMIFTAEDQGPFYLSPAERNQKRHDVVTLETKEVNLLKSELIKNLKEIGIEEPRGTKVKLQKICKD